MAFFQSFQQFTGLPELIALLGIFILGALVGSFLNVVIHGVPRGESIVFPNSHCPKCGSAIRPYDNIPIISWII
ncbi:prepilin peptidase, partial [Vibrio parahaemolyticus]